MSFCRCCDDSGAPIIRPLDDLEALMGWVPDGDFACVSQTPLRAPHCPSSGPRTLLCHDLTGGYLEDRYPQGAACPEQACYRFYHWHLVDTFVYFSHHFVTIPPPGWVAAAHRHGVRVLGTFITEWAYGAGLMRAVLESSASKSCVVRQLTDIARYYKFDGWLINIENKIEKSDLDMLVKFVSELTDETHKALPYGQVIWYDSVTNQGDLDWQNALNELNSQYFDACDGIFLNYTWTEDDLAGSSDRAVQSGRPWDVYVGVDVFGRNCFGGGGFNTAQAVGAARAHDLSVALFAVSWTLECLPPEDFEENENKFWRLLTDLLAPRKISSLPVWSDFGQGFGNAVFSHGKKICDTSWYNLALQSAQPNVIWGNREDNSTDAEYGVMSLCLDDAYEGGSCLRLEACARSPPDVSLFDLFQMNVQMVESLVVLYSWKPQGAGVEIFVDVKMENKKTVRTLRLCSETEPAGKPRIEESGCVRVDPISGAHLESFLQVQDVGLRDTDQHGWKTRCFEVNCDADGEMLCGVSAGLRYQLPGSRLVSALLGKIQVVPLTACRRPRPKITNLTFHPPPLIPSEEPASATPRLEEPPSATPRFQGPSSAAQQSEGPPSEAPDGRRQCRNRGWLAWEVTAPDLVDYYRVYGKGPDSLVAGTGHSDIGDWVLLGHSVSPVFCLPAEMSPSPTSPTTPSALTTTPSPATTIVSALVQPVARSGFSPRLISCPVIQLPQPRL